MNLDTEYDYLFTEYLSRINVAKQSAGFTKRATVGALVPMGSVLQPQHYPGPDPDEGLGVQHLPHGLGDVDHQHPVM